MAKELKDSKRVKEAAPQSDAPTMRENIRWISGFVILAVGVFIFCSIISYYFYWSDDLFDRTKRSKTGRLVLF